MRTALTLALVPLLAVAIGGCQLRGAKPVAPAPVKQTGKTMAEYNATLPEGAAALTEADLATLPPITLAMEDRARMQKAINASLSYLNRASADLRYPVAGVTKDQVVRSLQALSELLRTTTDEGQFNAALRSRFRALMSVGCDGKGTVLFTGYYTPIFDASLVPNGAYKYPIYKLPADLVAPQGSRFVARPLPDGSTAPATATPGVGDGIAQQRLADGGTRPYPTRAELEASGALRGLELVWFKDPYEAYIVEVQGSAKVMLTSGQIMEVGFAGTNGHPYHAIAADLVNEGKIRREDLSLATVRAYFRAHPDELPGYTARNARFIFFTKTNGGPFGSIGQPVTTDVTVATDKSIFPPGAACLATVGNRGTYSALRLDQDTGGAIRAAGRCDLYMGEGDAAERRAGNQFSEGGLYYLLLKE